MTDTTSNQLLEKLDELRFRLNKTPPYKEVAMNLMHQYEQEQLPATRPVDNEVQDELETLVDDLPVPTTDKYDHLSFQMWEALAYDIALDTQPLATIAVAYGITEEQIKDLFTNEYFSKLLQAKKDEVTALGDDASFTVKMRLITHQSTQSLLQRLQSPATTNKDFHALFRLTTELAKLSPKETAQPQTQVGATFTLNLGGVPGLEHLATPTPTPTVVEDADFKELEVL